jgi:hypothetical protein
VICPAAQGLDGSGVCTPCQEELVSPGGANAICSPCPEAAPVVHMDSTTCMPYDSMLLTTSCEWHGDLVDLVFGGSRHLLQMDQQQPRPSRVRRIWCDFRTHTNMERGTNAVIADGVALTPLDFATTVTSRLQDPSGMMELLLQHPIKVDDRVDSAGRRLKDRAAGECDGHVRLQYQWGAGQTYCSNEPWPMHYLLHCQDSEAPAAVASGHGAQLPPGTIEFFPAQQTRVPGRCSPLICS